MVDIPLKFPDVGNALAQGAHAAYLMQDAALKKAQENRLTAANADVPAAMGGDPAAFGRVAQGNPQTAVAISTALQRMDATKQAQFKRIVDYTGNATAGILAAPAGSRAALYDTEKQNAQTQGIDTSKWPQQYDENWVTTQRNHALTAKDIYDRMTPQAKTFKPTGGAAAPDLEPMNGPAAPAVPAPRADLVTPQPNAVAGGAPIAPAANGPVVAQAPAAPVAPAPVAVPPAAGPPGIASGSQTADMPMAAVPTQPPVAPPNAAPPGPFRQDGPSVGGAPPIGSPQVAQGGPPAVPAAPQGVIAPTDPALHGGQMMGHRAKPGAPLLPAEVAGHFVYRMPDGTTVLYRPTPNYESDPDKPNALRPIAGGPADLSRKQVQIGITDDNKDLHGEDFIKTLPAGDANIVRGITDGSLSLQDLSKRAQDYTRYLALAKQADPDFDPGPAGARRNFETKYMVNGPGGTTMLAANTASDHMKTYHDLMNAVGNGDSKLVNGALNEVRRQFGDAAASNPEVAKTVLATEIAKAVRGAGALNESEQQDYQKLLSTAQSPQAAQGALNVLSGLMLGRVHAIEDQAKSKGIPDAQVNGYFSPRAREALDYIKSNPIGGKTADGGGQRLSPEDAAKLAPGTPFIGMDGVARTRK